MYYHNVEKQINDIKSTIKLISCDIFDTLLYRVTDGPTGVFLYMYNSKPELFPVEMTADAWKNIRVAAERKAREYNRKNHNTNEVFLTDIYNHMPPIITNSDELLKHEIDAEKALCFVNEEVYSWLETAHGEGIKIVLLSDMYLNKGIITSLLHNSNIDVRIFDEILISCEFGGSKRSGILYNELISRFGFPPDQILHIGDNHISDIGVAQNLGINTLLYSDICEAEIRYPNLFIEKTENNTFPFSLYSYRIKAANACKMASWKDDFGFYLGAMILGPVLTNYAEWVVRYAVKNDINSIRLMMREGKFLGKLIENSFNARGINADIQKFYVSRLALSKAKLAKINKVDIEYLVKTHGITVHDVFETLGIAGEENDYNVVKDIKTSDLDYGTSDTGLSLKGLIDYLTSDDVLEHIRMVNSEAAAMTLQYLKEKQIDGKSITVDVGWKGSIHSMMTDFLADYGVENRAHNLMVFCNKGTVDNIYNGSVIKGYLGNFGDMPSDIDALYPRLIELFLGCDEGTTVGYKRGEKCIIPILKEIDYPEVQINLVMRIQEGILKYQKAFLKYNKNELQTLEKSRRIESLLILKRLFTEPFVEEANRLGAFCYDQNFGGNHFECILDDYMVERIEKTGAVEYWSNFQGSQFEWQYGLMAKYDNYLYLKNLFLSKTQFGLLKRFSVLQSMLEKINGESFALIGAGDELRTYLIFCSILGVTEQISCIMDNDTVKQEVTFFDCPVESVKKKKDINMLITNMNKSTYDQIYAQLIGIGISAKKIHGFYS